MYEIKCSFYKTILQTRNNTVYVFYTSLPALVAGLFFKVFSREDIFKDPSIYNVCIAP